MPQLISMQFISAWILWTCFLKGGMIDRFIVKGVLTIFDMDGKLGTTLNHNEINKNNFKKPNM